MSKEEDQEVLKVPEEMFKDVKFFVVGDIDPKVPAGTFPRRGARSSAFGFLGSFCRSSSPPPHSSRLG